MNREIKFRAWIPAGKMVYHEWRDPNSVVHDLWQFMVALPDDAILMQFTELKDKNGKEIYEGDIIKDGLSSPRVVTFTTVTDTAYGHGDSSTTMHTGYSFYFWGSDVGEIEIIGNIYENPELLKT